MNDFARGAACVVAGLRILPRGGVRLYVIVPLLVNVVLFGAAVVWSGQWVDGVVERWLPGWLGWLEPLVWALFIVLMFVVVFFGFTLLANLIGAPFNGALSAAVQRSSTGTTPSGDSGWKQLPAEVVAAISGELRKYAYFALLALPCLLLLVVPVANALFPMVWLGLSAWMLALEYLDYPAGNHGRRFPQLRAEVRAQKLRTLGLGCGLLCLTAVPVVNFLAMPAGVAAATIFWGRYGASEEPRRAHAARRWRGAGAA